MQMAARRFYAYYIRGRQLALVESDNVSGAGQTLGQPSLDDIGPSGSLAWKSPVATVADGLEIEYAYSPRYTLGGGGANDGSTLLGHTKFILGGWYVDAAGYLTFPILSETLTADPPYTPLADISVDDHIVIRNSSRWNGLHKVKSIGSAGVKTYTKPGGNYGTGALSSTTTDVKVHSDGYLHGNDTSNIWVNLIFSVGDFALVTVADASGDEGLYKVTSIAETDAGAESTQKAYLGTKYFLNPEDDIDEIQTGDSHFATDASITVYKVNYDPCYMIADVNVLNDEFDSIDLPEYLAKALVYYVKGKIAEDRGEIEQKEYFMREFRRILEKHNSSKIWGSRAVIPGAHGIR